MAEIRSTFGIPDESAQRRLDHAIGEDLERMNAARIRTEYALENGLKEAQGLMERAYGDSTPPDDVVAAYNRVIAATSSDSIQVENARLVQLIRRKLEERRGGTAR